MPARVAPFVLVGTLALLSGCSGQVVATTDADSAQTRALLGVEIVAPAGDAPDAVRTQASARFLRMASSTDDSLAGQLVGADLDLPPVGQCESVALFEEERGISLASLGPIDLVDVGMVTIEAGASRAQLAARAFPDVVDLVSGVVYTTRGSADSFPAPATYRFDVAGSSQIAPLVIETAAPSLPENIRIGGEPLSSEPVVLTRHALPLSWAPGTDGDLVYVDLTAYEGARLSRIRCTFADSGVATIPESALPSASAAGIALHRVHRQAVVADGIDGGEIRFDFAVSGTLRFETPVSVEALEGIELP